MPFLHLNPFTVAALHFSIAAAFSAALSHRRRILSDLRRDWAEICRRSAAARRITEDLADDWAEIRRLVAALGEFSNRCCRICFGFWWIEKEVVEAEGRMDNGGEFRCDVCGEETVRRYSRFRGSYYCSGKCLIIDWSRGHRRESDPSRVEDQPIVVLNENPRPNLNNGSSAVSNERPRPNLDSGSTTIFDEGQRQNLDNIILAPQVADSSNSVSYRSKVEELHNVFDEIEAWFSTSKIKRTELHSTNNNLLDSSLNLARPEPQLTENLSHEGFKTLSTKLDQLITEMVTLRAEVEILRAEIKYPGSGSRRYSDFNKFHTHGIY